ncbi:hypothetical protein B4N89_40335 [Embleya scabrispora]|uniref:Solute-binding protein family 5 domain-containing protein n=1 Tax=Embleya scabrispora TaxID=159449 RepID=A0A1T3NNK3_9ACTN|nr:hypothetical protein B4N89_40335 [Embleya scabrispora]
MFNLGLVAGMMVGPKAFADANAQPVGTGPYILDTGHTTRGDRYTYTRNPRYRAPAAYPFDKVVIKAIPDTNARTTALLTGQADAGIGAPARMDAAKQAGLTVTRQPGQVTGLWLVDRDGKIAPPLKDARVRQAINHAVDGPGILKAIMAGVGTPTTQMFAAGSPRTTRSWTASTPTTRRAPSSCSPKPASPTASSSACPARTPSCPRSTRCWRSS